MKIRNKITLMITGAGLLASLVFSAAVFTEFVEQPFELLDAELEKHAHTLIAALDSSVDPPVIPDKMSMFVKELFWIKIFDSQQRIIYSSDMVRLADIPLRQGKGGYTVNSSILKKDVIPEPDEKRDEEDQDQAAFRVRTFSLPSAGQTYVVQIARPMDRLDREIRELIMALLLGMVASAIVLILAGYFVAGRILRPISVINATAREINDRTLDKRLPLGKNRDELYELSASLNTMFDRLQYSFRLQKDFIASAAHELKTPLTIIRLFFEEMQVRDDLPREVTKRLICQHKTLSRMERLVKNLLDVSKLELKGSYAPRQFDLADLIREVLEDFETSIELAQLDLEADIPETLSLFADRDMIRRVLINIVDNGIKYNLEKEGTLRVQAGLERGKVVLSLYNTGPGIPKADLKRVFEQFFRVEKSRSAALGGSGLGLTIVKQIIRLHGGTITMESKEGSWARIRIILPITTP